MGCAFFPLFMIPFHVFRYFQVGPVCYLAAPDEDENELPPHPDPLPPRGEGKKNKRIQSSFSLDEKKTGNRVVIFFTTHYSPHTSHCIFRIDFHATFVAPAMDENPRFDIPWHVATLIK